MRVEDASRAFDDEAMQVVRPNRFAKSLAKAMEKIENERLLDLDLFLRTLKRAEPAALNARGNDPTRETRH